MGCSESVESNDEDYMIPPNYDHPCCGEEDQENEEQQNEYIPPNWQTANNHPPIINAPTTTNYRIIHIDPLPQPIPLPEPISPPLRPHNDVHELLAEAESIDTPTAKTIVQLFENHNTIPFMCRYRRDLIDNIKPEKLRHIKNAYNEIVYLRKKAMLILGQLEQEIEVDENIRAHILTAKNIKELEYRHAIYKPVDKDSTPTNYSSVHIMHAQHLLKGDTPILALQDIINYEHPQFDTLEKLEAIMCGIISDKLSKHPKVIDELYRLQKVHRIILKCTKASLDNLEDNEVISTTGSSTSLTERETNLNEQLKYEQYYNFKNGIRYIKPHQVLAINRGERSKILKVHLIVPDGFKNDIKSYISHLFMSVGNHYPLRSKIFNKSFEECYTVKLMPLVRRQVHDDLNEKGKKAALVGFARNLKQLLLMPPLKGEPILGIDPGFTNGCKLAVISQTADVLDVGVVYPFKDPDESGVTLANMLTTHSCKIIALGNGTACRETEAWIVKLFKTGFLVRNTIRYHIVSEQGASIYSCSDEAKKEFPNLDVTLISAVSIARRLNDPLSEYVKIEPRHLGVGMYQHDINQKFLSKCLKEVVLECVSYVGVDINTASLSLLKHVAGLDEKRAEKIIQYRERNGPFRSRKDLLKIKGLGKKSYVQCAGFIRIEPKTVGGKIDNMLDCTWVHPESYKIATDIINLCDLKVNDIGTPAFTSAIRNLTQSNPIETLTKHFRMPRERLCVVLEALQREVSQDYRSDKINQSEPLFKKHITQITDLFIGEIVTGEVRNILDFGAFVDIGIECDALIHKTKMNGIKLNIGDRVSTSVLNIEISQKQVQLRLDEVI